MVADLLSGQRLRKWTKRTTTRFIRGANNDDQELGPFFTGSAVSGSSGQECLG